MSQHSESINELMGSLAKAQGEMSHAVKDSKNPHFKSNYADLASVWQACREPLSKHGLAVTQTLDYRDDKQILVTTLSHVSGQWMKSYIVLPLQKPGPQELGSCLSYCRRYSLAAMVGVYQDDDDAESAEERTTSNGECLTDSQYNYLKSLFGKIPLGEETKICADLKINSLKELPKGRVNGLVEYLNQKIIKISGAKTHGQPAA